MVWRQNRFKSGALASAEEIIAAGHPKADYLAEQCEKIRQKWAALTAEAEKRRFHLEAGTEAYQFFSDCNETDSVIKVSFPFHFSVWLRNQFISAGLESVVSHT